MRAKLLSAMQAMENPRKDAKADAGRFSYQYATLPQVLGIVKPALYANGLGLLQGIQYADNIPYLVTSVFDESEILELSRRRLYDYTDAQAEGSGLTYARRYELLTVFGLAAEDNDGASTKNATVYPATLSEAQQMLWNAVKAFCAREGIEDAKEYHKRVIMTRPDYSNDIEPLTRIAMELS